MTDLQGWQKVAREIGDYDPGEDRMVQQRPRDPIGHWLPAEAAAKEILRLRERNAVLEKVLGAAIILHTMSTDCGDVVYVTAKPFDALIAAMEAADQQQETDR